MTCSGGRSSTSNFVQPSANHLIFQFVLLFKVEAGLGFTPSPHKVMDEPLADLKQNRKNCCFVQGPRYTELFEVQTKKTVLFRTIVGVCVYVAEWCRSHRFARRTGVKRFGVSEPVDRITSQMNETCSQMNQPKRWH